MFICPECGSEMLAEGPQGFCGPCELRYTATLPPKELDDMKAIMRGEDKPNDAPFQVLKDMWKRTPRAFLDQKRAAEREYRESLRGTEKGEDVGTGKAIALLEKWLKENQDGPV